MTDKYTTTAAARILGVEPQTIRNRIKAGKLEGFKEEDSETGKVRYYVTQESLENERIAAQTEDIIRRYTEEIVERIHELGQNSRENMASGLQENQKLLEQILKNQERSIELFEHLLFRFGLDS